MSSLTGRAGPASYTTLEAVLFFTKLTMFFISEMMPPVPRRMPISLLLGYKDISTTQRYAHHCPESLRSGVKMLDRKIMGSRRKRA